MVEGPFPAGGMPQDKTVQHFSPWLELTLEPEGPPPRLTDSSSSLQCQSKSVTRLRNISGGQQDGCLLTLKVQTGPHYSGIGSPLRDPTPPAGKVQRPRLTSLGRTRGAWLRHLNENSAAKFHAGDPQALHKLRKPTAPDSDHHPLI